MYTNYKIYVANKNTLKYAINRWKFRYLTSPRVTQAQLFMYHRSSYPVGLYIPVPKLAQNVFTPILLIYLILSINNHDSM